MHKNVTTEFEPSISSSPARTPEWLASEPATFAALRLHIAGILQRQSSDIAARWEEQARIVALRESGDAGRSEQRNTAVALVESLAATLASDGATSNTLVALGLGFGVDAFELGGSLHHTLKGLDLLSAMTLYAMEGAVAGATFAGATVADGIRISRRLQQGSSLLTLAVTKGYTQAMSDAMRDRFRHLRHDLRNPLGTIKSVLAMMDDETMPAEARAHPRFRAMAKRNARSLGELIADRLSDVAAILPTFAQQSVSLRTIACGVRRDLRAEAEARAVTVLVAGTRVRVVVDAVGLELMLHEMLLAALHEAGSGDEVSIDFGEARDGRVTVVLLCTPARPPVAEPGALDRLTALAARVGAELGLGDEIVLSIPVQRANEPDPSPEQAAPMSVEAAADALPAIAPSLGAGEPGHDVRGARQRDHGESCAL
jgi:signal transduction histidine kinase